MISGICRFLPSLPDGLALGWGLLLGKDESFSPEMKQMTRAAGVSHLTAASGANIQLIQGLALPLQGDFWLHLTLKGILIPIYILLSGLSGSLWRASFQSFVLIAGSVLGRPVSVWWNLVFVLIAGVCFGYKEDLGFLLSWLAVFALYFSQTTLSGERRGVLSPQFSLFYNKLFRSLFSGATILLFVSPLLFHVFGVWQPHGLLSTFVSQPVTNLYTMNFLLFLFFRESNKVADKIPLVSGFSEMFSSPLQALLSPLQYLSLLMISLLFGVLWNSWRSILALPGWISNFFLLTLGMIGLTLIVRKIKRWRLSVRDSQQWGWRK